LFRSVAGLSSLKGERAFVNRFVASGACAFGFAVAAADAGVIFAGTSLDRAASAEFTVVGTQMTVRLTNTSTNDVRRHWAF